jgi:thioredoxin-dependent peroxiredoxin
MRLWETVALALVALSVVAVAGAAFAADPPKADLKVGDPAPSFTATDDQGKEWKSSDHVGKKVVVVYFYPADFTGGCTKQACSFRDDMTKLTDKGIEVVGISGDSAKNHEQFKKAHKLNYTLLADEEGSIAKKFGVPVGKGGDVIAKDAEGKEITDSTGKPLTVTRGVTIQRWTFVIDKEGKIAYKNPKVNPSEDPKQVLEAVEKLEKK